MSDELNMAHLTDAVPVPPMPQGTPESTLPTLRDLERVHIRRVLASTHGNQRRAARILGISRWSLARRLKKHGFRTETDSTKH